jgi:DNA primase
VNDIFSFIRDKVDILLVVSQYVNLKEAGSYWKGLSPFKNEKTPSFTVSPNKKIFYCFSSHIGGDAIDFVSRMEKCSQIEAAQFLMKKYNINAPAEMTKWIAQNNDENKHYKVCDLFKTWAHRNLSYNVEAKKYLEDRGISSDFINKFEIGYCPKNDKVEKFTSTAIKNGILHSDIVRAGIIYSQKYSFQKLKYQFSFEDRIIFPIENHTGICSGFGSRVFKKSDNRAKYVNSPSCKEFTKGNILYGFSKSRSAIQQSKKAFIVEGYFDTISMHQNGYVNTVATMGTSFTEAHISSLSKITDEVVIIYDGDESGRSAVIKLIKLCWQNIINTKIVNLPAGEDPASLAKDNRLSKSIIETIDGLEFFIDKTTTEFKNSSMKKKEEILCEIIDFLKNINDEKKLSVFISEISNKLSISHIFLQRLLDKSKISQIKENETITKSNKQIKNKYEELIIAFIYCCISLYKENKAEIDKIIQVIMNKNTPEKYKNIWDEFIKYFSTNKNYEYQHFFAIMKHDIKEKFLYYTLTNKFSIKHLKIFYRELQKVKLKELLNSFEYSNPSQNLEKHRTLSKIIRDYSYKNFDEE